MTVRALIAALSAFDPDLEVELEGFADLEVKLHKNPYGRFSVEIEPVETDTRGYP